MTAAGIPTKAATNAPMIHHFLLPDRCVIGEGGESSVDAPSGPGSGAGIVSGSVSTMGFTVLAASVAMLAMLWLLVVDRPKTARAGAIFRRSAPQSRLLVANVRPTKMYRAPGVFVKIKAVLGLGTLSLLIAALIASMLGIVVAGGVFFLRSLLS